MFILQRVSITTTLQIFSGIFLHLELCVNLGKSIRYHNLILINPTQNVQKTLHLKQYKIIQIFTL